MNWNDRYSEEGFVYGTRPNAWLEANVSEFRPGGRILCLADGEGRNGVWLAQQGFEVTSVDMSEVGLTKAAALAEQREVELDTVVADLSEWDLGNEAWDGIVSIFAHMPGDVREDLHSRAVRALKPGGVFLLEAYTPRQLEGDGKGGPPVADLMMYASLLERELQGLQFDVLTETTYTIDEGEHHTGDAHVVRVIGRK
jgi:SAM-dependent methyltransferase